MSGNGAELASARVAGVDEAGRGPLAGPVVAAAVILGGNPPPGLADSKQVSERVRERLYALLVAGDACIGIGMASAREIEDLNILWATMLAMRRAVEALSPEPGAIIVDGTHCPDVGCEARAVVGADGSVPCVSAASIVAKVTRDRIMQELDARYPEYGFARHKGYPTPRHLAALREHGACIEHRRTYGPVRKIADGAGAA